MKVFQIIQLKEHNLIDVVQQGRGLPAKIYVKKLKPNAYASRNDFIESNNEQEDEIKEEKCITIAFVGDERICDGHYYATSFKQLNKYLKRPELLEKPPKNIENNNISEKIEIN